MEAIPADHYPEDQQLTLTPEKRVISGFWRRILAFVLDGLLLGLVGIVVGIFFFDPLARSGGWGRLLGFCVALAYGGILNSSIGKGQTIGKRITKVEVVNSHGEHISPGLSTLRYAILAAPFFLNGALIAPSIIDSPLGHLFGLLVFGFGGAILYLYIFNRRTRQSLHDLACGTFVVKVLPKGEVSAGPLWKPHVVIIGVLGVLVLVASLVVQNLTQQGVFPELLAAQKAILSSGNVHAASVSVGKTWGISGGPVVETTHVESNAIWKRRPLDYEAAAKEVASAILKHYPDTMTKNVLSVTITYGYDIGIAQAWRRQTFRRTPLEWSAVVAPLPAQK
jgi:uncharacterized RDD family membrane protein YckC